jgi:hypothetical protein
LFEGRLHFGITNDPRYLSAAEKLFDFMITPLSNGGCTGNLSNINRSLSRYITIEEYPIDPPDTKLNGFIFALLGVYDWSVVLSLGGLNADEPLNYFQSCLDTLKRILPYYDIGGFSAADLGHLTVSMEPNPSLVYHGVHIYQLHALYSITGEEIFRDFENLFAGYVYSDWQDPWAF